jgi:membrane-bound serine protease (ClpP class)
VDPIFWIILFVLLGAVLIVAELLLPSHGLLGVAAIACFAVVIGICFSINRWLGIGVLASVILLSPLIGAMLLAAWQKSPVGKRLTLTATAGKADTAAVMVGQTGVAVSDLRPTGECEFNDHRLQATSDSGLIHAGTPVRVIAFANGVATVRPLTGDRRLTTNN